MENIPRKSTGGRRPELQYTYQIFTLSAISCTTVWRGIASHFNASNPPPFSFQIYITDPSIPVPPLDTPSISEFSSRPPPRPGRGFAAELLDALIDGSVSMHSSHWRLDIWWVNSKGEEGKDWGAEDCLAHYRSMEVERRGQLLHTVPNYAESCEYLGGTSCKGLFFVIDGVKEWKWKGGVRVVEFDPENRSREQWEDDGIHDDEDPNKYEKKWGTKVRDWRGSTWVPPQSPRRLGEYHEPALGSWMNTIHEYGILRHDYNVLEAEQG
ncbi:MAG: hypothetical protein Q9198_001383 [Flavoplaca austrocitrina]